MAILISSRVISDSSSSLAESLRVGMFSESRNSSRAESVGLDFEVYNWLKKFKKFVVDQFGISYQLSVSRGDFVYCPVSLYSFQLPSE